MFIKDKPSSVLVTLLEEDMYLSELARKAGVTYVYVTNLVSTLISKQFVSIISKGKYRIVKLTEKGREMAMLLKQLKEKDN